MSDPQTTTDGTDGRSSAPLVPRSVDSSGLRVTVVVVTYRAAGFIGACLESLRRQTVPHQVLIIDNASSDGTTDVLRRVAARDPERITVRRLPENLGFAGGVAAAVPEIDTPFLALLNDDAVADPDWLETLLETAEADPEAAAWTSLLELSAAPGTVNSLGTTLDRAWYGVDVDGDADVAAVGPQVRDVFGFCGGAALLRTAALRAVGGFPADFFLYYEDLDTSWRLRLAGWDIRAVPRARVMHRHAATSNRRSALFHFHNERNRLWTLLRCAPTWVFAVAVARFAVTTGSLAGKRLLRRPVPDAANFRIRLRLRVLAAVLRQVPRGWADAPGRTVPRRRRRTVFRAAVTSG
ncbi:glycosyltransferase family 2 protein [Nakamurella leprariae]|uniref:Glycosyltransferase family 2 protein n=1 Tax=Nakamurella leprariae TaxID=2803911 RepID=A0A938YDA2_9ACTN|nr:glycosyltransferase family 2 protein [Nakamurella leprariae]MBM9467719.1 glycosyltransferase family 2 protein [Nakamurella leprariae]